MSKLGIVKLLTEIGDNNLRMQNLDTSAITLDWSAKKGTTITFGTDMTLTPQGTEKLGLVIWVDRARVQEIIEASKESNQETRGLFTASGLGLIACGAYTQAFDNTFLMTTAFVCFSLGFLCAVALAWVRGTGE